jgi:TatA/E family protein of Tat protein translocase
LGVPFDGAFSPVHIVIVALVALVVLGPEQLPKIARQAGQGYREFMRVKQHLSAELRDVVAEFDAAGPSASDESPPMLPPTEDQDDRGHD